MTSIFLGLPYTRPDCRKFTRSLANFTACTKLDVRVSDGPYGFSVEEARNILVEDFFREPADFLMYVDNDAAWAAGSIDRLVSHNLPIVCGGMYTKDVPPRPTVGKYMGTTPLGSVRYHYQTYVRDLIDYCYARDITGVADNAILFDDIDVREYDGCGMHFTLIRKDVLESFGPPWFLMQGKTGAGEDFYFCQQARNQGFKIYSDLSVQTAHCAGEVYDFGIRELLKVNELILKGNKESELIIG